MSITNSKIYESEDVLALPHKLLLELNILDTETIAELWKLPEGEEREQHAIRALRIGLLALKQARGEVDTQQMRHEATRLIDSMQNKLEEHSKSVHTKVEATLKNYFDPKDGRFEERLHRLIDKDGELESLLKSQIGGEGSQLTKTLSAHFGEESPLLKLLSPDQSKGLLASLRDTFDEQLNTQQEQILKQFSLDNDEGALVRFISELTSQQGELSEKLHGKIDEVVKEFSLDDDNSALSRLVRNVERAQKTITSEFSLDEEQSALSRLKVMLEETNSTINSHLSLDDDKSALARLKKEMFQLLDSQRETNQKFQEEVKSSLREMIARKEEAAKSTQHGLAFEDALFEKIQHEAQKTNDIATNTSNHVGLIKSCKVGDCTIELGPDAVAAGAVIVVEAKEDKSYTLTKARDELEIAGKNRGAQVSLFVFSSKTAPSGIDNLSRLGNDIFIVWDAEDARTDLFLEVGITLARALCIREQASKEAVKADFTELDKAILEIEKRANAFDDIETWTKTIRSNAEKIMKKVNTTRKSLLRQVETLRTQTDDLKHLLTIDEED